MPDEYTSAPAVPTLDRAALYAVNFFMADMEASMGPFLGVLLQSRGWSTDTIGGHHLGLSSACSLSLPRALVDATSHISTLSCVI